MEAVHIASAFVVGCCPPFKSPRAKEMAWSSAMATIHKGQMMSRMPPIACSRKKERERENSKSSYKVVEISPPPKSLGVRCFPSNLQCGESVTIEGETYTISAVTLRYQLRKGRYEPREKRLDVLSTGRYILNLYLHKLLEES